MSIDCHFQGLLFFRLFKIENDFKAEHDEDFQELNNLWYHLGINFSTSKKSYLEI